MNGRKAKLFRSLAAVTKEEQENRSYHGEKSTVRTKEVLHPNKLDTNGKPLVLAKYQTATYKLNAGPRLLYKMLKKQYKKAMQSNNKSTVAFG